MEVVAQLLSFPIGRLWAKSVPNWRIFGLSINPGSFISFCKLSLFISVQGLLPSKASPISVIYAYTMLRRSTEHVLITLMATVGATSAYATDIVAVQRVYYGQTYNFSCRFPFLLRLAHI